MSYIQNPVTGNRGVDIEHTCSIPAPAAAPGFFLVTQSRPLPVIFEGWLLNGAFNSEDCVGLLPGESLQAFYPEPQYIPASAGESPGDDYRFTVVRIVTRGGWLGDISADNQFLN